MPRAFTVDEREQIHDRLKSLARDRLATTGCRKTTVEDLARAAGISKGAFYLFQPSREVLFFRVLMEYQEAVRRDIMTSWEATVPKDSAALASILMEAFRRIEASFLPGILARGDLEWLATRVPAELHQAHHLDDASFVGALMTAAGLPPPRDPEFWAAAFRALFLLLIHKAEIGEEHFDAVLYFQVESTVKTLWRGGDHD